MLKIGKNILQKRKERNITQEELAEFMMVTKASVSKWETGQSYPDILLLPKLATYFNISVDELIGYEPELSLDQIKNIYLDLQKSISDRDIEDLMEDIKYKVKQYYSCFEFLYYMSLFILNHSDLIIDTQDRVEYLEYANSLLKRVWENSNDPILKDQTLNLRAACLISLGRSDEALHILPSSDMCSLSKDYLVASAYLETKDEHEVDKKLQIMIYSKVIDLLTLLMMKSGLGDDDWVETTRRTKDLIETFNIIEINFSLVLNYYLSLAIHHIKENNFKLAHQYLEKFLNLIIENKDKSFEIRGDEYFNQIDTWLDKNLLLATKPNRSDDIIIASYLNALIYDESFKEILAEESIKNLIDKVKGIYLL